MKPLWSWQTLAIEKALAPPPLGSTATVMCETLRSGLRASTVMGGGSRLMNRAMSSVEKAFSDPSALMPKLSRSSMACVHAHTPRSRARTRAPPRGTLRTGSSANSARTVSTFFDESHLGMDANL